MNHVHWKSVETLNILHPDAIFIRMRDGVMCEKRELLLTCSEAKLLENGINAHLCHLATDVARFGSQFCLYLV